MVQLGLGNSMLYERVARGFEHQAALVPLKNAPKRPVALDMEELGDAQLCGEKFRELSVKRKIDKTKNPVRLENEQELTSGCARTIIRVKRTSEGAYVWR